MSSTAAPPRRSRGVIVTANGSQLGASHQLWMMNEINKLIWPSVNGVGYMNIDLWDIAVLISQKTPNLDGATVITARPPAETYTTQYAEAANATLEAEGLNTTRDAFAPITVTLKEGGAQARKRRGPGVMPGPLLLRA